MTTLSWIRKLFARRVTRPIRKVPHRVLLALEALEARVVPSTFTVMNKSGSASTVGSLPYVVAQAKANNQANTILFDSTVFSTPQTIALTGTQLELSDTAGTQTITGPQGGVTVSGGGLSRVFQVDSQVTASISGLTISGGNAGSGNGGGLSNLGTTTLTGCTVNGISALGGGALYNAGLLMVTNCTVGSWAGAGNVTLGSGILTVGGDNTSTTFSGVISGTGGLTKLGSGTLTLSGTTNSYTGATAIDAGTLQAGATDALSASSAVSLANAAGAALNLNNFSNSIAALAGGGVTGGNVTLGSGTLTIASASSGSSTTYGGVISGTGGLVIKLTGTGAPVQALSGTNSYTGATAVDAGTLAATVAGALGPVHGGTILVTPSAGNTAILDLSTLASLTNAQGAINLDSSAASSTAQLNTGTALTLTNAIGLAGPTDQFNVAASTTVLAGAITGTGGLTKVGSGTLNLSGSGNTYTGTTTIDAGTLAATAAGALGPAGGGNILITPSAGNSAILDISTLAGLTNTKGAINFDSSAASSTAQLNTGTAITLTNAMGLAGPTDQFSVAASTTVLAGAITGTGGLTEVGSGTLQLNGTSNTYSGTTTIDAGTLLAGTTDALSASSAVSLANLAAAALNLNNFSNSIAALAGGGATGGNVTLGSATLTLASAINSSSTSYAGVISGNGGLTINLTGTGAPVQTLSGTNTYTGTTTINAGTLAAGAAGALGPAHGGTILVTPAAGNTAILDLSALASLTNTRGAINFDSSATSSTAQLNTGTAITLSNAIGLAGSTDQFNVAASATQLGGAITGTGGLTKVGSGTLNLSGSRNSYTGATTIDDGTLAATAAGALGPAGGGTILVTPSAGNSAVLDLSTLAKLTNTNGAINFNSSAASSTAQLNTGTAITLSNAIGLTGSTDQINVPASTTVLAGAITGTSGLTKVGSGTLNLSGSGNTYTGTTTIDAGTLAATAAGALGPAGGGNILITPSAGNSAILDISTLAGLTNTKGAINFDSSAASSTAQLNTGTAITLTNAMGLAGPTDQFSVAASTTVLAGAITGTGGLTEVGSGTLQLNGTSNTYSGTTTIDAGTLQAGATDALSASSAVSLANVAAAALNLNNFSNSIAALAGGGATGGNVTLGSGTLTIASALSGSNTTYGGAISGTGGLVINLTGTGAPVQTLSATNNYTGTTTINAGTLAATAAGAFGHAHGGTILVTPSAGNTAILDLSTLAKLGNTNGAINFNSSAASSTAQLNAGTSITLSNAIGLTGSTNQFNVAASTAVLAGAITGTGGLTKVGSGTLTLSGSGNTYTGATTIDVGTLAASAAGALGPVGGGNILITPSAGNSAILDLSTLASLTNTRGAINFNSLAASSTAQLNTSAAITLSNAIGLTGSTNQFNVAASTTELAGAITGTGGLTKVGSGTLQLNGTSNTYSGMTTIDAGTLLAGATNALSPSSAVSLANVAAAVLNLNNFSNSIAALAGGGVTGGNVTLGSATLTIANALSGSNTMYGGVISGTGGLTINLTGTGAPVQTLSGTNTYAGTTTIDAGTLAATAAGAFGPAGGGNILVTPSAGNSAILDLSALASLTNTRGAINFNSSAASSTAQLNTSTAITLSNAIGLTGSTDQFNVAATSTQLAGAITGTGGLTKVGSGTLQLNGTSNTYSGMTTIDAGTLLAGATNALSANSVVSLANVAAAMLNLNNFSNSIAALAGGGVTGGNVTLGSATLTIANATNGSNTTYGGAISGTGGLVINLTGTGAPVQTLSGTNTYTGKTTIDAGALQAGGTNALSASSVVSLVNVAAAALNLNNFSNSIAALAGGGATGGNVKLGSATLTIANASNGSNTTYSGVIGGTGSLVINLTGTGAPVQTLSGTNTYTGTTTIAAGTLAATAAGALGPVGGGNILITPSAGNSAILDLSTLASLTNTQGTINFNSSAASSTAQLNTSTAIMLSNAIGLTGSTDQFNVAANTTQLAGAITGTGGLTKLGSGTLTLSGTANSYSGTTTVSAGTLQVGATNALSANSAVSLANVASAMLNLNNFSNSIAALAGGGVTGGNVTLGSATLTIASNGSNTTYAGVISGTGSLVINLTGSGAPVQTLSGTNTYTGTTTIDAGTLAATAAGALGHVGGGNILITPSAGNSAILDLSSLTSLTNTQGAINFNSSAASSTAQLNTGSAITLTNAIGLTGSDNNFNVAATTVLAGAITGTAGWTKSGAGVLIIAGVNTSSGGTTITGGTLQVGNGGTSGSLGSGAVVDNGTLVINRSDTVTVNAPISGTGTLTQAGNGTTTLTGANTNSGGTNINNGTLQVGNGGMSGSLGSGAVVDNGTLVINRSDTLTVSAPISGTGTLTQAGNGSTTLTGANTNSGGTNINNGTLQVGNGGTSGSLGSGPVNNNGKLRFDRSDAALLLLALISGSGEVDQDGSGTTTLTGDNTYSGGTNINNGTLQVGNGGTSGSVGSGNVDNNGKLRFNRRDALLLLLLLISGSGEVDQDGSGTTTLAGDNTYTGPTNINAGTLQIGNGSALPNTTDVTIAALATLNVNDFMISIGNLNGMGGVNLGNTGSGGCVTVSPPSGIFGLFGGIIHGLGCLTMAGAGTLTLSGLNTFTGTTFLNAGTLKLGITDALPSTTDLEIAAGAVLLVATWRLDAGELAATVGCELGFDILSSSEFGEIALADPSVLAGELNVTVPEGFDPPIGTEFPLITDPAGLTGTFDDLPEGAITDIGDEPYEVLYPEEGGVEDAAELERVQPTITTLSSSTNEPVYGQSVTFTATVASEDPEDPEAVIPEGTVTFEVNGIPQEPPNPIDPATGKATFNSTFSIPSLGVGTNIITAEYSGDEVQGCLPSIADPLDQRVYQADTMTTLTSSSNPSQPGQSVTFTATVSAVAPGAGTPKGDVVFTIDGANTTEGLDPLTDQATLSTSDLTAGAHTVIAAYQGDSNFNASTSASLTQEVGSGFVWTGGSNTTSDWSDGSNWQGGMAPSGPDAIAIFPAGAARQTNTNDLSGLTIESILFSGNGYAISGDAITLPGGITLDSSVTGTDTFNLNLSVPATQTFTVTNAGATLALGGILSGAGGLTEAGAGSLDLAGADTYGGATTINDGTLQLEGANDLPGGSDVTVAPGAELDLNNNNATIAGLEGAGDVNLGSATLKLDTPADATFNGQIFDPGEGSLIKEGPGTQSLGGDDTYTGTTTILEGTLAATSAGALGDATGGAIFIKPSVNTAVLDLLDLTRLTNPNAINFDSSLTGSTAQLNTNTITLKNAIGLNGDLNYVGVQADGITELGGAITGTGNFITIAPGTLTLSGANGYTGATYILDGTLAATNADALGDDTGGPIFIKPSEDTAVLDLLALTRLKNPNAINFDSSAGTAQLNTSTITLKNAIGLNGDLNYVGVQADGITELGGAITGTGNFITIAPGTLTLSGANGYTGATYILDGTLAATNADALGDDTGGPIFIKPSEDTAVLDLLALTRLANPNAINFDSSLTDSNAKLYTSTITLKNAIGLNGDLNYVGVQADGITELGGAITGTGNFITIAPGTLTLSGANGYRGATYILDGTLAATNADALGDATGGAIFIQPSEDTAILDLSGVASLMNPNAINFNSSAGTAQLNTSKPITLSNAIGLTGTANNFNVAANITELSGVISGSGGLTELGSGTLTLSGANIYTDPTTVTAGTLLVNGSLASGSAVSVASGATLGDGTPTTSGTVNGTVSDTGIISPGQSYGSTGTAVLNTGNLTFNAGSVFDVDLNGTAPGSGYDQLNVSGTAALGNGILSLNVSVASGFTPDVNSTFTIIMASTSLTGTFAGLPSGTDFSASTGQLFQITYTGTTAVLTRIQPELTVTPNAFATTYNAVVLNNTSYSDNTDNYTITGFVNGQTISSAGVTLSGSMAFNGSTSTSVLHKGTYTQEVGSLVLSSTNGNYSMTFTNYSSTFSDPTYNNYVITPKLLTYSGLSVPASKVYDGTTTAVVSGTAVLQPAELPSTGSASDGKPYFGDTVNLTGTPTGTYNSQDVATASPVTFGGLSLSNTDYTLPGSLTIIPTFDPSIAILPGAEAAINAAIAAVVTQISSPNNITVAIYFTSNTNIVLAESETTNPIRPYYNYYNAFSAVATGPTQLSALASLGAAPTSPFSANPTGNGNPNITFTSAEGRNLGFNTPGFSENGIIYDGIISLNTLIMSPPNGLSGNYSLQATATHEIDEVLGIGGSGSKIANGLTGPVGDLDLYRYSAPGVHSYSDFNPGTPQSQYAYFSIDGGKTDLSYFNEAAGGDYGDWYSSYKVGTGNDYPPGFGPQVQDAFAAPGTNPALGVNELTSFAAIGYYLASETQLATITPKPLTYTGLSVPGNKVYDGTTTAVVSGTAALQSPETAGTGTTSDGIPYAGDTVSLTGTATGAYNSKDVATATTVTFGGLSLTGSDSSDYTLTASTQAATITPKPLTYSGLSVPASKVYDGTTTAVVSGTATLQTAEAAGAGSTSDGIPYNVDGVSLTGTPTGTYNTMDVATATTVTFAGLSLTGTGNGNYSLTVLTQAATITQAMTTTTLISSSNPSEPGQSVTITATVSAVAPGAGSPTGNVVFTIDGANTTVGLDPLTDQATLSTSGLTAGAHTVTAAYQGDDNFDTSTASLTQQAGFVWSGGSATTSIWSDGANWQGGMAPTGLDEVVIFPAGAARQTNTNDVSGLTIQSITFSGNGYTISGNAITLTEGITLDSGVTGTGTVNLNVSLPDTETFTETNAGAMLDVEGSLAGAGGLTELGSGTLQLSGTSNTYSGPTTIDPGTFQAGATNAFSPNSAIILDNVAGAILDLKNFSNTIAALAGGGATGGNVTLGAGTLTIASAVNGSTTTYGGVISGTGGLTINLTGTGTPVQTLSGTNSYTGTTTIDAGTLAATAAGALGPASGGNIAITPSAGNTAVLDLPAVTSLTNTNGAINFDSSRYDSDAELHADAVAEQVVNVIGLHGLENRFSVNSGNTTQLAGRITGDGGLMRDGSGTLQLSNTHNTYSGPTIIDSAGTVQAGAANAFSPNSAVILDNVAGAILDLNGFDNTIASLAGGGTTGGDVTLGSGTLTIDDTATDTFDGNLSGSGGLIQNGASSLDLAGDDTYTGATTINEGTLQLEAADSLPSGSVVTVAAGATLDLNNNNASAGGLAGAGNVTLGSGILTIDGAGSSFSGVMSGTGGLTMAGTGTENLSGANTYTGATTINAGTLQQGAANALSSGSAVTLANAASAILDLNSFDGSIASLAGGGATGGNVTLGSGTLTIASSTNAASAGYAGSISGTGGLTMTGAQFTITLSGANSYTGQTTVSAETLLVNGSLASAGTVSVTSGATLGGGGTVGTITAAGVVSPGEVGSTAILSAGNTTFNGGSDLTVQLNGTTAGSGYDQLNVTGTVNLSGSPSLNATAGFTAADGDTFSIITAINGLSGTFNNLPDNAIVDISGQAFRINYGSNSVTLTRTGVAFVWTGGSTSTSNWSDGANWQGGTAPSGTDANVFFPAAAARQTNTNDVSGLTIQSIFFSGNGYTTSGNAITLITGITLDSGVTGTDALNVNLSLPATPTFTETDPGATLDLGGIVSGAGGLTEAGAGTLTLTGNNTYSGATTISAGTLQIGAGGTTGALGTGTVTDNATLAYNLSSSVNVSNAISGSGTLNLTSTGGGITQSSAISVASVVAGASTGITLTNAGNGVGTFNATNSTSGAVSLTNTSSTLTVSGITQSGTASGSTITISQTGALSVTGAVSTTAAANGAISLTSTGGMTVADSVTAGGSGNLTLTANAAGTTSGSFIGIDVVGSGGIVQSTTGNVLLVGTGGNIGMQNPGIKVELGATVGTTGATGTVMLQGTGGASSEGADFGVYVVNSGSQVTSGGGNITLIGQGGGTGTSDTNEGINIQGAGTVTAGGSGTVTIQGTGGDTTGTSNFGFFILHQFVVTTTDGDISITAQGGGSTTIAMSLEGGTITAPGSHAVTLTATGVSNGGISILNTVSSSTSGAINVTAAGNITGHGFSTTGTLTTSSATGTALTATVGSWNATNSTSGDISLTNTAPTLSVTGLSEVNGGTATINNTGNVTFAALNGGFNLNDTSSGSTTFSGAVGSATPLTSVTVTADNVTAGAIATTGGLTITNTGTASNISGVISGTGGLTKRGAGTLTLSGANTYSGALTQSGGTLILAGTNNVGSVTVSAGSLIIAAGSTLTVAGDFNNEGGVTLEASGAGAGIIRVGGNYTQGAGATLTDELAGAPASGNFGQLIVTGTANLAGTLTVQLVNGYVPSSGDLYRILTDAAVNGDFDTTNLPPGGVWDAGAGTVTF